MTKSKDDSNVAGLISRSISAFFIISGLSFACLFTIFGERLHAAAGNGFCIVACICLVGGTIALIKLDRLKSDKEYGMPRRITWISVDDQMPKSSTNLFLVLVTGSTVPALAIFTGRRWKVQPLFAKWFVTTDKDLVTHWHKII